MYLHTKYVCLHKIQIMKFIDFNNFNILDLDRSIKQKPSYCSIRVNVLNVYMKFLLTHIFHIPSIKLTGFMFYLRYKIEL